MKMFYVLLRKIKKSYRQWLCSFGYHEKFMIIHSKHCKMCYDCGKVLPISDFYAKHTR